ncbi:MAG: RidA family protein [Vicinamibacteria bacterium]|nr:RidA family protein [Vicinamibacteria bacterium]
MSIDFINPPDLGPTPGFSHGQFGKEGGRVLFVAGQIGVGGEPHQAEPPMVTQFGEALRRILRVVEDAGGEPQDVGRMTIYVTDIDLYRRCRKALGGTWRSRMGSHYPAMALVEVKALLDPLALVEIEATAVIGGR